MISYYIVNELKKLGFKKDPKTKYDYQVFECDEWSVWFELEGDGMYVWIDRGGKIIRNYCQTNMESKELIQRIAPLMKKTV